MSLYINDNFFSSSILPYACGHKACWPGGHSESKSCFATSGELSAHFKDIHIGDNSACEVPPFRCGLKGCGKSWKVRLPDYHPSFVNVYLILIHRVSTGFSIICKCNS